MIAGFKTIGAAIIICLIILGILYAFDFLEDGEIDANNPSQYIFPDGMTPSLYLDGRTFLCQYGEIYVTCEPEIVVLEDEL